jgi:hypothetical protein
MSRSMQSRAKAAIYRRSPEGRLARSMYNQKPEVAQRRAIRRAMKLGKAPPAMHFQQFHYPKLTK